MSRFRARFPSFTEKRRARVRKQVERLDRLENRGTPLPLGAATLGWSILPATDPFVIMHALGRGGIGAMTGSGPLDGLASPAQRVGQPGSPVSDSNAGILAIASVPPARGGRGGVERPGAGGVRTRP